MPDWAAGPGHVAPGSTHPRRYWPFNQNLCAPLSRLPCAGCPGPGLSLLPVALELPPPVPSPPPPLLAVPGSIWDLGHLLGPLPFFSSFFPSQSSACSLIDLFFYLTSFSLFLFFSSTSLLENSQVGEDAVRRVYRLVAFALFFCAAVLHTYLDLSPPQASRFAEASRFCLSTHRPGSASPRSVRYGGKHQSCTLHPTSESYCCTVPYLPTVLYEYKARYTCPPVPQSSVQTGRQADRQTDS